VFVGGPEGADDELAGLDRLDVVADLLDDPAYSWPIGAGHCMFSTPR
jgi:hypothetical protein